MWLFNIFIEDSGVNNLIYVCLQDITTITDPYANINPAGTINVCLQDITTLVDPYTDINPAGTINVCLQDISGLP